MRLGDDTLDHLREVIDEPDLSGTKYRLLETLGQGGMGHVFVAEDTELRRKVALKVLRVGDAQGELVKRMQKEARTAARLEHPGIIPVHDLGLLPDGRVYYVTKLVHGQRLDEFAASTESVAERLRVFLKICEAVSYAHSQGVLHRDVKPANIMVGEFGEVLVLDWGTAGATEPSKGHTAGHGTPGFMSPEQCAGATLDARADVYALGATLYVLLTRDLSLDAARREHLRSLPRPLAGIIRKEQAQDLEQRYGSAKELADDIVRWLDGEPVSAYRETPLEKLARFLNRNRFIVIILLTYMVIRLIFYLALKR
ncbi:MAG: serine/threonine protein kinase [bacterium]|nr:serine/threonine protein kinase [bacterium]